MTALSYCGFNSYSCIAIMQTFDLLWNSLGSYSLVIVATHIYSYIYGVHK